MKSITIFTAAILPFTTNADGACPTINQPVLCISSEGRHVFSNLCFAEAAGFESADCKLEPIDSACPTINEPVFCTSTPEIKDRHEFSNICFALEAGYDSENCGPNFSVDPVEPDFRVDPIHPDFSVNPIDPDFSVDPIDPDFSVDPIEPCSTEYKPVDCGQFVPLLFNNICFAEKAGFDPEFCYEISIDDSACPTINEPVFCTSTPESKDRHEFSNICFALEAGHDSENCGPNFSVDPVEPDLRVDPIHPDFSVNPIDPDFSVDPIDPDFSVDPKLINLVCDTIYKPVVCTATPNSYDYNKFSNLCEAEKAGFDSNNCILKTGGLRGQKPTM
jgi:hypothetical protein